MKVTTILIFAVLMQVSAAGLAQKITLNERNASLESVMDKIRAQTGFEFLFNVTDVDNAKKVNLNVRSKELSEVLESLFENQALSYSIKDKFIVLKPKEKSFLERVITRFQTIDVRGRIVDLNGVPLPGASVKVRGSSKSTTTNAKGEFYLQGVDEDAILIISFIGYSSKEIEVAKEIGDILLELSTSKLDEVQVIAYGQTTRRLSTGNIGSVKAADIEKQPVNNPLLALQGRVPGLVIEQTTGLPGSGVRVRIQGQNSINNGNDPLFVVDGVPYASQSLSTSLSGILGGSGVGGASGSPLSYLNPASIESIEVLKDADATAIYGSRAANGAILITTKRGKAGKTIVAINVQNGFGEVENKMKLLNTPQYLAMRHEAFKNDNAVPGRSDYDLNGRIVIDTSRYTDWQEELIGKTAAYNDMQASVSGGSENTQFTIAAGYHGETTVFPGDFSDKRGSLHFSLSNRSTNRKFHIQLMGSYLYDDNQLPGLDLTRPAMTLPPLTPSLRNPDGTLNWMNNEAGSSSITNPLGATMIDLQSITNNLVGNLELGYQLFKGLEIKSTFGYNSLGGNEVYAIPMTTIAPSTRPFVQREASYSNNAILTYNIEPQISYKTMLNENSLEVLVGSTVLKTNSSGRKLLARGFNSDETMRNISAATSIVATNNTTVYRYNALFARLSYNYKSRYLINISGRRDGSSRFGSKNQFHNFAAVGAAWIFSDEKWVKNSVRFLSFGKLRASYGTTGNDQIGDYNYLSLYQPIDISGGIPYQGIVAIEPRGLTNPYLQWEETRKLQIGIDLGLLKERIAISSTYFDNRSSNQLLGYILPEITGFTDITSNFPATVKNYGWELGIETKNIQTKNFVWSSSLNITIPKNKLIRFENLAESSYGNALRINEPINVANTYRFARVDPNTGVYQFYSAEGTFISSSSATLKDKTGRISLDPKYYGGLSNSLCFKNFQLDFLFQFVSQIGKNYSLGDTRQGNFNGWSGNQPIEILNRWQKSGDITPYQKISPINRDAQNAYSFARNQSDYNYGTASFIRLKNLSVSYALPKDWIQRAHLQSARIFVQGQNLLTITDYFGLDPESKSTTTLPPLRVVTLGANLTL